MKICLIGDPHFANRKMFGGSTRYGVNDRLATTSKVIRYIAAELPNDVSHAIVLGDITHDHGLLTPPVQNEILACLNDLTFNSRYIFLLSGNHDLDANGLSILRGFARTNIRICENPGPIRIGSCLRLHAIPFCSHDKTITELKRVGKQGSPTILFMHHHFDGAVHGKHEFTPPGGLSPFDIPDNVLMVFTGHYHKHHRVGSNITYVGAPLQHDFGEADYDACYHILEIVGDKWTVTTHEIPGAIAPRFHILPHNLDPAYITGSSSDYYRIDWPTDESPLQARELAKHLKNVIINPVPVIAAVRSRVEEHLKSKEGERVDLEGVIDAYAALHNKGEQYEVLSELGLEIARSVLDEKD
jgi:hypothetical protein